MGRISSVAAHPPVPILVHSCFRMDRIYVRASIRFRNSEGKPLVTKNARFCEIFHQILRAILDNWYHPDRPDHDQTDVIGVTKQPVVHAVRRGHSGG